jgi:hypothetical protein
MGGNVFDVLGIDGEELEFWLDALERGDASPVALIGHTDGESKVVIFMSGLCRFTSMCLCIELDASASAAASVICRGTVEGIVASGGVCDLAQGKCNAEGLREAYGYIVRVLDGVGELCMMKTSRNSVNIHEIRRLATSVADFIGISLDANNAICVGEPTIDGGTVFAGGFCACSIIMMTMLARKYSSERELSMVLTEDSAGVRLDFSFVGDDVPEQVICDVLSAARSNNVAMSYQNHDGVCRFELIPHYEDVGLVGLKAHDDIF